MIAWQPDGVVYVRTFLAITLGILLLFAGKAINRRVDWLRRYCIPEPVTGGLLCAAAICLVYLATGYKITFDLAARDVLLVYFFTTIGINARLRDVKAGGRPLVALLIIVAVMLFLQNAVGVTTATLLGYPPAMGLLAGSVSLQGGHGTAIAWAPAFAARDGLSNALEIGVLCATAGLVLASLLGGPVAEYLLTRHRLRGTTGSMPDVGVHYGETPPPIEYFGFLHALLAIHLCGIAGILAHQSLMSAGLTVPLFLPCLLSGIVFTNLLPAVAPRVAWPNHTPALALIAEVSLGVFLAMSLMSMQLWALAGLAGPIAVLLVVQALLIVAVTVFVAFRALGGGYDAAVICAGFIGFGLGATPTAMANMTAITQRHGASPTAFLVVPLVGAFLIDIMNAAMIHFFLGMT